MLAVRKIFLSSGYVAVALLDSAVIFIDMLFGKLYLKRLEFNLLGEQVELTVILHIVKLLLIAGNLVLRVIDFFFLSGKFLLQAQRSRYYS